MPGAQAAMRRLFAGALLPLRGDREIDNDGRINVECPMSFYMKYGSGWRRSINMSELDNDITIYEYDAQNLLAPFSILKN